MSLNSFHSLTANKYNNTLHTGKEHAHVFERKLTCLYFFLTSANGVSGSMRKTCHRKQWPSKVWLVAESRLLSGAYKMTSCHKATLCDNTLSKIQPCYWAIQAGLLIPLNFAQHRLSPLAAFTSGAYFLHNGRRWQWICEFYTANIKGIFWGT